MADKNAANKKFQWESLESSDYKQYIVNLRAIGCPEQTIRDIIVTDVDRTYCSGWPKRGRLAAGITGKPDSAVGVEQEEC